jgi:hypothetical protein
MNNTRVPLKRLHRLQSQFKNNYNKAQDFFCTMTEDSQQKLLNQEFFYDKNFMIFNQEHSNLLSRMLTHYNVEYLYTPSVRQLKIHTGEIIHIYHNIFRTISAYLLEDCSMEEKIIILSKSMTSKYYKSQTILQIAEQRLKSLENYLNINTMPLN